MMLESFVLYVARDRATRYGKEFLSKKEGILDIFAEACKQMDIVMNKQVRKPEEYIYTIIDTPIFNEVGIKILFLKNNLGVKHYDTNISDEEKRKIVKNSISCFDIFFQDLKENYNYHEFKNKNHELKDGDYIIENLKVKLEDNKEVKKIFKSIENIDMNFIINYNGQNIYPIITDLLIDIVAAEYQWSIDKKINQAIITEWEDVKKAQKEREVFKFVHLGFTS